MAMITLTVGPLVPSPAEPDATMLCVLVVARVVTGPAHATPQQSGKAGITPMGPAKPPTDTTPGDPGAPVAPAGPAGPAGPVAPMVPRGPRCPRRALIAFFVSFFSAIEWFLICEPE